MHTQLVKFKEGEWGILVQKKLQDDRFVDLNSPDFTWSPGTLQFRSCRGTEAKAREVFKWYNNKPEYEVVEEK
jgi:hypothetical protein